MASEYDYTIWAGDSDDVEVILSDKNGPVDLSAATIVAVLEGFSGSPAHEISCTGNSSGVVTIPLTPKITIKGSYRLKILVTISEKRVTFPNADPRKIKIL